jgi:hypothetical protein
VLKSTNRIDFRAHLPQKRRCQILRSWRPSWLARRGPMGKPHENRALIIFQRTERSASPFGRVQIARR